MKTVTKEINFMKTVTRQKQLMNFLLMILKISTSIKTQSRGANDYFGWRN